MEPHRLTRSYKPPVPYTIPDIPVQTSDEKLKNTIACWEQKYMQKAERIESLNKNVTDILACVVGLNNEKGLIYAGHAQSIRKYNELCLSTYAEQVEAFGFLTKHLHFYSNAIDVDSVQSSLDNLNRKVLGYRATAKVFATIKADDAFQALPSQFMEIWRKEHLSPTVPESKVFKRIDGITKKSKKSDCGINKIAMCALAGLILASLLFNQLHVAK